MLTKLPITLTTLFVAALLAGCSNSPPGEGITNGPSPTVLRAEDNPAMRTDLQQPDTTAGDASKPSGDGAASTPRSPK